MDQMMAKLRVMYVSSGSEVLKETEAHRRSPAGLIEPQQQAQQSAPGSSGASEQARPTTKEPGEIPVEENRPIPLWIVPLSQIDEVMRNEEEYQSKKNAPTPTVVVDVDEENADMNLPISSHLKRRKSMGHSPKEAVQKKESIQEKTVESSSVLPTTTANQPSELLQRTTTNEDKGKAPMEVDPACLTIAPDLVAQPSSTTPTPTQKINVTRNILDSVNQALDARIAAAYAWVDEGLYVRNQDILLATDPRRLRGAMMVNVTEELSKVQSAQKSAEKMLTTQNETIKELRAKNQSLKERVELNKKKRRDMTSVLNEYDERLKVNVVKEFVHSSKFEDGLARVIGPWFKNGFSFCTA
ncbi:hypothetical protein Dimus_018619 [Dionaea muscipula]